MISLHGWFAIMVEDNLQMDTFTLSDPEGRNVYKFKTSNHGKAVEWCKHLNEVAHSRRNSGDENEQDCLIDFNEESKKEILDVEAIKFEIA